jgi:hypothetical protein
MMLPIPAPRMWQWIDADFGPMGTFTDKEKRKHERAGGFGDGTWREVPAEEYAEFLRWCKRLWYEQS